MSAVLDTITDLSDPAAAAREIQVLNDRLAGERTVPPAIAAAVREIASGIEDTNLRRWETIDPTHAVIVLRSAVSAQRALEEPYSPAARDQLRVALESIRQSLAAIAEREPVSAERTPKEIVQWLAARTEVPQSRLAELLGVSARQLQRWLSTAQSSQPEGDDARRVRLVARIVNQLRFALTPAGTVEWFGWVRSDLGSRAPAELLDDPIEEPRLLMVAGAMRSTLAF
jgi:DNA-binding transcriptional regulator YiaG